MYRSPGQEEQTSSLDADLEPEVDLALAGKCEPHRWSRDLFARFEHSMADRQYQDNRFLLMLGMAIMLVSIPIDYQTIPERTGQTIAARLLVVLPFQLIGLLLPLRLLGLQKLVTGLSLIAFGAIMLWGAQWAQPVTGALMAVGPLLLLGISTPLLPYSPREVAAYLAGYALALALVAAQAGGMLLREPVFVGILVITLMVAFLLQRRMWALKGHNFLLSLRAEQRLANLGESNDRLVEMSRRDPLTGLANRRHASESFARHFAAHPARGEARAAVMMLDLDRFKQFNDNWGHQAGDECLRAVAEEMRHVATHHGGLAARFGGEEFVIIFRAVDEREALARAEDLRRAIECIEIAHPASADTATCTASIGVAVQEGGRQPELSDLLSRADAALYAAKRAGRNRCEVAD